MPWDKELDVSISSSEKSFHRMWIDNNPMNRMSTGNPEIVTKRSLLSRINGMIPWVCESTHGEVVDRGLQEYWMG